MADEDPQARLIQADIEGIRIVSAYFPNGQQVGTEKYQYKIEWMKRLKAFFEREASPDDPLVLCGDFNIAVDEADVANPEKWSESVLCHADGRKALQEIRAWGFVDVFRRHHPGGGVYSWWDYRMLAFPKGDGVRIDHVYATTTVAERSTAARVDRNERKGKKPSDHAPVIVEFD